MVTTGGCIPGIGIPRGLVTRIDRIARDECEPRPAVSRLGMSYVC
jgi:hypothetical protein